MSSICFFSSYFNGQEIPYYVTYYLENLIPHFNKIVFITNEKAIHTNSVSYLKNKNIELMSVKNEGWDFGMWYKAFLQYDVAAYDKMGLINDSCILYKPLTDFFNWESKQSFDYCGMVDSNAISYHIQSYFIIINKRAIEEVYNYFILHGILPNVKDVISIYEVGLSTHLIQKSYKLGACYPMANSYKGEYSPTFLFAKDLIKKGFPLIKKKIIFSSYRKDEYLTLLRMNFDIHPKHYIRLAYHIKDVIEFNRVLQLKGTFYCKLFLYNTARILYQQIRKIKRIKV